ncbi:hypothetical protein B0H10DRAFT_2213617 [Mycena sp. CBHHK59/15]|nr:hypothetical protein B0H10DRAFT_2213617 [Mycena sp. CBHHK59/15]
MSSSAPGTPPHNPLSDVFGAMNEESPVVPIALSLTNPQKRSHAAIDGATSDDEEGTTGTVPVLVLTANQNAISALQRYSERKRLRVDQTTEVTLLLNDPPAFRHAKIMANLFHVANQLSAIVTAQPTFEVSSHLEKNISNYAVAVLLSSKISAYKGSIPINTLLDILKKFRFDLPAGIENNPADYGKVVAVVQDAFTQLRSKFKKALSASVRTNKADKTIAPGPEHQNIFKLTQIFVDGTRCTVTVELCARVALMRAVFLQDSGPKYWDKLDASLASIRSEAKGDAKKITRAFRHILTKDQNTHGVKDYEISDTTVDNFQQEVDDLIDAGATDLATSVAVPAPAAQPDTES